MTRLVRWVIGFAGVAIALLVALVVGVLVWITVLLAPLPEQNASSALDGLLPPTAGACRAS